MLTTLDMIPVGGQFTLPNPHGGHGEVIRGNSGSVKVRFTRPGGIHSDEWAPGTRVHWGKVEPIPWDHAPRVEPEVTVFGVPVRSAVRWMGADAWTVEQVEFALSEAGVNLPHDVVSAEMKKGRAGDTVPDLDDRTIRRLYALVD